MSVQSGLASVVTKEDTAKAVNAAKASSKDGQIPRPSLKNLTRARVPKSAAIGLTLVTSSALLWKVLVSDRHKREQAHFYKNYDPERDYARMKTAGVFRTLENKERPDWLADYESEIDQAIEALRNPGSQTSNGKKSGGDDDDDE